MKTHGKEFVFGVMPIKPLVGFPDGKTRIRMRNNSYAKVFVRSATSIHEFTIEDKGDKWAPGHNQGKTTRIT